MLKNVRLLLFLKFEGLLSKSHCWQVSKMCVETFWNLEFKFSIKLLSNILLSFLHNVLTFVKTNRKLEFLNVFCFFRGKLVVAGSLFRQLSPAEPRAQLRDAVLWSAGKNLQLLKTNPTQPSLTWSSLFFVVFPNL